MSIREMAHIVASKEVIEKEEEKQEREAKRKARSKHV